MSHDLVVHRSAPGMSVQDQGRPGFLAFGLSRGGAADRLALVEGAALLGQDPGLAAIEMAGMGGEFEATDDIRIALTGAPMRAAIGGVRVAWNASHLLPKGVRLAVGAAGAGTYGYLHVGGGLQAAQFLGGRSAHLGAGIGAMLEVPDRLAVGSDPDLDATGFLLDVEPRFAGGLIRIVASLQTHLFSPSEIARFEATTFRRDIRGNRMGVRLAFDDGGGDAGFQSEAGLSVLSEIIVPGDIQITGDGAPFVLLSECQTTGGYPRIGSVLPVDLPKVVQAQPGTELRFSFISIDEAVKLEQAEDQRRRRLGHTRRSLVRNPHDIADLLSYQLVDGVTAGDEFERDEL